MPQEHFWFVDDEARVRWAVRVSAGLPAPGEHPPARIVFTSRAAQVSADYPLDKPESDLARHELLELLAEAKREAGGWMAA